MSLLFRALFVGLALTGAALALAALIQGEHQAALAWFGGGCAAGLAFWGECNAAEDRARIAQQKKALAALVDLAGDIESEALAALEGLARVAQQARTLEAALSGGGR